MPPITFVFDEHISTYYLYGAIEDHIFYIDFIDNIGEIVLY